MHRCEPYVYAQMIAGKEAPTPGEAKNSWLTGTAAWNFVALTQWILGIRPDHDGLRIDPCLPADWEGFDGHPPLPRRRRTASGSASRGARTGECHSLVVDGRRRRRQPRPARSGRGHGHRRGRDHRMIRDSAAGRFERRRDRCVRRCGTGHGSFEHGVVDPFVTGAHPVHTELLGPSPAGRRIDVSQAVDSVGHLVDVVADESADAVLQDLRHGTATQCDDGRAGRQRLDHHQTERLRPIAGEERRRGTGVERRFGRFVEFADVVDIVRIEQRLDLTVVIGDIDRIDLGGNAQRPTGASGDLDGEIWSLLFGDPSDEGEVLARPAALLGGTGRDRGRWARSPPSRPATRRRLPVDGR